MRTYIAFVMDRILKAYIVKANSKAELKKAGMNMKLDWLGYASYEKAIKEITYRGAQIK